MSTPNQQAPAAKNHLELVLNLQHSRRTASADADAARARAQALVIDVLKSRLDVDTEAGTGSFLRARGFTDAGKALAASRALQLAFEGFRSTAEGARTSISMVLDCISPEEAASRGSVLSVEQKELFRLARSSRVLITQALYDHATGCQLLKLRSFSPRAGVYEFLWTSEERLDELQAETDFVTDPALQSAPLQNDTDATVVQRAATNPRIATASKPVETKPEEPAMAPERPVERTYVEDVEPAAKRSGFWVIALACAAAVLIAVGGLVFWHPGSAPPVPKAAQVARAQVSPPPVRRPLPASTPVPEVVTKPLPKKNRACRSSSPNYAAAGTEEYG